LRVLAVAVLVVAGIAVGATLALGRGARAPNAYVVRGLVADRPGHAARTDRALVNAWGIAASPTGPWWTSNEATESSTLYEGGGRKQLLTVHVDGGPTGIAYYGGKGFLVRGGHASDPARFVYACEDGMIRAWTPTVPAGWSTSSEVVADAASEAAVFRGVTIAGERLYATDFHNGRVDVYDAQWRRVRRHGTFVDRAIPAWYAPFGIQAVGSSIFVTYVWRAPVNGNDAPTSGYVDEFDLDGRLLRRVAAGGVLNAPWGIARAPGSFGRFGGDLLIGNFGDGHVNAYRRQGKRWLHDGVLRGRGGKPLAVSGLWGIGFGNGGSAGPAGTLFFGSGPHVWRGVTEAGVHGLLGTIVPAA
jgi:uncharacterized protein (TIGR03118 family)